VKAIAIGSVVADRERAAMALHSRTWIAPVPSH
jgi:hypothetical protein